MKVWIFGQHAAGKSTIGKALSKATGATLFDADRIRPLLWPELGHSQEDRDKNILRLVKLNQLVPCATVTCAITPFEYQRQTVKLFLDGILLVHVRASEDLRISRDPKGLYKQRAWLPFEEPGPSVLTVDGGMSIDYGIAKILRAMRST